MANMHISAAQQAQTLNSTTSSQNASAVNKLQQHTQQIRHLSGSAEARETLLIKCKCPGHGNVKPLPNMENHPAKPFPGKPLPNMENHPAKPFPMKPVLIGAAVGAAMPLPGGAIAGAAAGLATAVAQQAAEKMEAFQRKCGPETKCLDK